MDLICISRPSEVGPWPSHLLVVSMVRRIRYRHFVLCYEPLARRIGKIVRKGLGTENSASAIGIENGEE